MTTLIPVVLTALMLPPQAVSPASIHEAARAGDLAAVRAIVAGDHGLVDAPDERGTTPLQAAVVGRHADVVTYLLEQGADVNRRDRFQATPLLVATEVGAVDIVKALLAGGAEVNAAGLMGTALHRAVFNGRTALVRLLLDAGADIEALARTRSPLHLAVTAGRVEAAALLIACGANIDARDGWGRTPLHTNLGAAHDRVRQLADLLLDHGAAFDTVNTFGETPLMTAVVNGHAEVVGRLLDLGADPGVGQRRTGRTLLHLAAVQGYGNIVGTLLARGLDPRARDAAGQTPLDYARRHGNVTAVTRLEPTAEAPASPRGGTTGETVGDREALVWYLKTRGWALQTAGHVFVFDNEESGRPPDTPRLANGYVSAGELAREHVVALYTCYHAKPGTMEFIHGMEDELRDVTYVNRLDDPWRGGRHTVYMSGQETVSVGEVTIHAAEVDDSAFTLDYLVEADGLAIFYAGFYPDDLEAFRKEIDHLAGNGRRADIAFIHAVAEDRLPYLDHVMARLHPTAVFLMSPDRRPEGLEAAARLVAERYPGVSVRHPVDPGDRFRVRGGRIQ